MVSNVDINVPRTKTKMINILTEISQQSLGTKEEMHWLAKQQIPN